MKKRIQFALLATLALGLPVTGAIISPPLTEFVILGEGRVSLGANVSIAGSVGSGHHLTSAKGLILLGDLYARNKVTVGSSNRASSEISGAIMSGYQVKLGTAAQSGTIESDRVVLSRNSLVDGDVTYQTKRSINKTAEITGALIGPVEIPLWQQPALSVAPLVKLTGVSNSLFRANSEGELQPGEYNKLTVGRNATLMLTHGDYYFNDVVLNKGVVIIADTRGGDIALYVTNKLTSASQVIFAGAGGGELTVVAGKKIVIGADNQIYADLTAYDGIVIKNRSLVAGTVLSQDDIKLYRDVQVNPALEYSYQFPEIPEPASILFLVLGSLFFLHRKRHSLALSH